jgi:predicted aspartyl protease
MKFSLLFFALLTLAGSSGAANAEDCVLNQAASLPMTGNDPTRIVVDVSIGGKPRHFLVDTGGFLTSIYQDVADSMGLSTHAVGQDVEIYNVKGARSKRYARIPDLAIGMLKGDNIPVLVEPRAPGSNEKIDGILAPDILSRFDLDFDFANRKLNLFEQDHCAGTVVYWSDTSAQVDFALRDGKIVIPMMLDGHKVSATLDTGSRNTHLYQEVARDTFNLDDRSPGMEPIPGIAPGSLEQFRYRFRSLSVAGLAIGNPLIYILPDRALESFARNHTAQEDLDPVHAAHLDTTDMLLGMDVLSRLHLYIAYEEHKIYLTAVGAH